MPQDKNKSENYSNLSGLNQKISKYLTGPQEFLQLQNVDAATPGSLSSVWGDTQSILSGITSRITGIADFFKSGVSNQFANSTYNIIATTKYDAGNITGQTYVNFYTFLFQNVQNEFSFSKNDSIYAANGFDFFKYPAFTLGVGVTNFAGITTSYLSPVADFTRATQYSLPKPLWQTAPPTFGTTGQANGITGQLNLAAAFVRADGFVGPASYASFTALGLTYIQWAFPQLSPITGTGTTFTPSLFNIVGMRIWADYSYDVLGPVPFFGTRTSQIPPISDMFYGTSFIGDATMMITSLGGPATLILFWGNGINSSYRDLNFDFGPIDDPDPYDGTFLYGPGNDSGATTALAPIQPTNPACMAVYANQLFMGGFNDAPDTTFYSRIGEFEKRDPENNFDFRANDGDILTCYVSYFTQLIIFKVNSVGALTGTDTDTYSLSEVTNQYGCVSPNGAVIFQQRLWFLDKQGICEYNGANTQIVSNKVQAFFDRMNVSAANQCASMIHVKERNQVQCYIPIDGATECNLVVFYDYLADFWGTDSVSHATAVAVREQGINKQVTEYGDFSGMIYHYGQSLTTHNGQATTLQIQTRFLGDMGHSVEKQWRRLYIDATIPTGSTYNIAVNLYSNQGSSPIYQTTMTLNGFQNRIDFGVPSADLSVELIYNGGQFLRINGYTIEYRFQRAVSVSDQNS